jgi:acyl-CoA thioester hydrolase
MTHRFSVTVYYEDTDMGGIVYHANFLKFIERARSDWVASMGIDQLAMRDREGVVFAVRRVNAEFIKPARFGEVLDVRTDTASVTGARLVMDQVVWRGEEKLFAAQVTAACITLDGRPTRLPEAIRQLIDQRMGTTDAST